VSSFLKKFPSILYSNTVATNIIAKINFEESVTRNLAVFFPYQVEEGQRPDQIAENYYGDPNFDWVIYLSNNIIDPYHQWPKTQNTLDNFIKLKFGSIANAQQQVAYYRVNFENDENVISTAAFEALAAIQKQYWSPILGYNNKIINYQRKEIHTVVETNKIILLQGTFSSLNENDLIKQSNSVKGTVSFANSTNVVIKHVVGDWQTNTSVYHSLSDKLVNTTITSVSTISTPISSEEIVYFSPVSYYDIEFEKNESMRNIKLLDNQYIQIIDKEMQELFK